MAIKNFRMLTFALILSGGINILCLAAYAYTHIPKHKGSTQQIAGDVIASMKRNSFKELVSMLTNQEQVSSKISKRELAVAFLAEFHHFDLERALQHGACTKERLSIAKEETIPLYSHLTEEQFESIIRFAYHEKWPMTAQGLFCQLQSKGDLREDTLEQAFVATMEYQLVAKLFEKGPVLVEAEELLNLITEGSWDLLEKYCAEQKTMQDFSVDKRRSFLLSYLSLQSVTAAELLLKLDMSFALNGLDDGNIIDTLALLHRPTDLAKQFCIALLKSKRNEAITQAAAMTLFAYAGELPTAPIQTEAVLARFAKEAPSTHSNYIVKGGDSLWKISKEHHIKVDEIVELNGLEKDALFPGMTLKLPVR